MKTVISSKYAAFYKAAGEKKFSKDLQENFAYFNSLYSDRLYITGVPTTPLQFPVKSQDVVFIEEDSFGYYTQSIVARRIGSKFFFKSILTNKFTFKGGKMYGEILLGEKVFAALIETIPRLEWFKSILKDKNINSYSYSIPNKLWIKIFSGKITNPKMFWNEWSKVSYHNMVPGWALKIFKINNLSIYDAELACSNLCSLAKKIEHLSLRDVTLIKDLVKDCISLRGAYQIDPSKSMDQLDNEHLKNIEKVEVNKLKGDSIYNDFTIAKFKASNVAKEHELRLITSAVESYKEAKRFGNCSYNHYWEPTSRGRYALIVSDLYDTMIGLNKGMNGWVVDQIYGHYNRRIPDDLYNTLGRDSIELINSIDLKVINGSDDNCIPGLNIELVDEEPELPW